jgi:hypothetical protein
MTNILHGGGALVASCALLLGCCGVLAAGSAAMAGPLPLQIGECSPTTIQAVGTRLDGTPDSGSSVSFANGGYQVSYDTVSSITASRAGDPVLVCLVSIPQHCPPGDARGRIYRTTNERTHQTWVLPDAEHSCGGA